MHIYSSRGIFLNKNKAKLTKIVSTVETYTKSKSRSAFYQVNYILWEEIGYACETTSYKILLFTFQHPYFPVFLLSVSRQFVSGSVAMH